MQCRVQPGERPASEKRHSTDTHTHTHTPAHRPTPASAPLAPDGPQQQLPVHLLSQVQDAFNFSVQGWVRLEGEKWEKGKKVHDGSQRL